MVDVADSKSAGGDTVWVRAPPPVPNKQRPHRGCCLFLAFGARTRGLLAKRWERFATRGGLPHTAGRAPPPVPRRRKLRIACDDFLCSASKAISRALRYSSFPNRAHFVGLRFGYITLPYQNKQRPHLGTLLVSYNLQFEASRHNSLAPVTVSAKPTGTETATQRRLHPCRALPSQDTALLSQAPIHP